MGENGDLVLVTGGSGFIGRHVVESVLASGRDVVSTSFKNRSSLAKEPRVVRLELDLLNKSKVEELFQTYKPHSLIHTAWSFRPGAYDDIENEQWKTVSETLADSFYRNGGKKAVFCGSCFEYDWRHEVCLESDDGEPSTLYGRCKKELGEILRNTAERYSAEWAWARIFFVYGPHEGENRFVPAIVNALLKGEQPKCTHGRQIRDYVYVADVADALVALLKADFSGICNVGTGQPVSLREIGLFIERIIDTKEQIKYGAIPARDNEPQKIVADTRILNKIVGWVPQVELSDGLKATIDHWRFRKGTLESDKS